MGEGIDFGETEEPERALRSYLLMIAVPLVALVIGLLIVLL